MGDASGAASAGRWVVLPHGWMERANVKRFDAVERKLNKNLKF
jgi:hypothetical protein